MQTIKLKKVAAILSAAPVVKPKIKEEKMTNTISVLDTNFPPPTQVAIANSWHLSRYYYEAAADKWYLVVDAKFSRNISRWTLCEVDALTGKPVGANHNTAVDLWADRFADRPFDVRTHLAGELESTSEWFSKFVANKDIVCQMEMFDAYTERLRFMSSYQALVRLGIVAD